MDNQTHDKLVREYKIVYGSWTNNDLAGLVIEVARVPWSLNPIAKEALLYVVATRLRNSIYNGEDENN